MARLLVSEIKCEHCVRAAVEVTLDFEDGTPPKALCWRCATFELLRYVRELEGWLKEVKK